MYLGVLCDLIHLDFPSKILYKFFTCHSPSISLLRFILITFCEEYKLLSSSVCSFLQSITSSLWIKIFSSVSCFGILGVHSSLNVKDQSSHLFKTQQAKLQFS